MSWDSLALKSITGTMGVSPSFNSLIYAFREHQGCKIMDKNLKSLLTPNITLL